MNASSICCVGRRAIRRDQFVQKDSAQALEYVACIGVASIVEPLTDEFGKQLKARGGVVGLFLHELGHGHSEDTKGSASELGEG